MKIKYFLALLFTFCIVIPAFSETVVIPNQNISVEASEVTREDSIIREIFFNDIITINTSIGDIKVTDHIFYDYNQILSETVTFEDIYIPMESITFTIPKKSKILFHRNGKLKECQIIGKSTLTIDKSKVNIINTLKFHDNGKLKECTLQNPATIQTDFGKIPIKNSIVMYANGKIRNIELSKKVSIKTKLWSGYAKDKLSFFQNGQIDSISFYSPIEIESLYKKIKIDSASFYEDGNFKSITFSKDTVELDTIWGKILAKSKITFLQNKKVDTVVLAEDFVLKNQYGIITFDKGSILSIPYSNSLENLSFTTGSYNKIKTWTGFITVPAGTNISFKKGSFWGKLKAIGQIQIDTALGVFYSQTDNVLDFSFDKYNNMASSDITFDLDKTYEISFDGGKFKTNQITFYKSNQSYSFNILEPVQIETDIGKLNIDDRIHFYNNGKLQLANLCRSIIVNTSIGSYSILNKIVFYENGKLKTINFLSAINIQTPCGLLPTESVDFYDDGILKGITLSQEKKIRTFAGNITSDKNSYIGFNKNGSFQYLDIKGSAKLSTRIGYISLKKAISFTDDNELESAYLITPIDMKTSIGLVHITDFIDLYKSGKLKSFITKNPIDVKTSVGNFKVKELGFYESGELQYINIDSEIVEIETSLGKLNVVNQISFTKSGLLLSFITLEPIEYKGRWYGSYEKLNLY